MPRNTLTLLVLAFLAGCSTTVSTQTPPAQPTPSSQSGTQENGTAGSSPQPGVSPSPGNTGSSPSPANPLPNSSSLPTSNALGQSLKFSPDRLFLTAPGEKKRLSLVFSDVNGQALPLDPSQLQWSSNSPKEIAVDSQGEVTALTDFAIATIRVNDPRSGLSAIATVDVTSSGTGNFSGPAPAPTPIPAPAITSFGPTFGPAGTVVTVNGSNFTGTTAVTINGVNVTSFTVINDNAMTITVPPGVSSGLLAVTTPAGNVTSTGNFTFAPTLTGLAPSTGVAGTVVTLTGSNLTGTTAVTVNGINAPTFTVVNNTTVTVSIPAGNTNGNVVLTTPGGNATAPTPFVVAAPTLTGINPNQGATGAVVTLTGTNLSSATAVQFGGTAATSFTVNSNTQITATVPASLALGAVQATVTTPGGTTSGQTFTVTSRVVYVNTAVVGGNNNGSSWGNAFSSLTAALTASAAGQEVWIAAGTYTPAGPGGDRNATFQLKDNVNVYGGFNATQTLLTQRDPQTHVVILNGDLNGNDDNSNVAPGEATRSENSFRVVTGANSLILEGVTISGGNGNNIAPALLLQNNMGVTLNNLKILNNTGPLGGGLFTLDSNFTLNNGVFHNNSTTGASASALNILRGSATINNVVFAGNRNTTNIGAVVVQNNPTTVVINNGTWFDNTGTNQSGGLVLDSTVTVTLRNCILWGSPIRVNSATSTLNLIFTTIENDVAGINNNGTINNDGNTLATDPMFATPGNLNGGDQFGDANDGLQLQPGSPAANSGTATGAPATDITGLARPVGGGYDRGAYERTP